MEMEEISLSEKPNDEIKDWADIFARLDNLDGIKDDRICQKSFLSWLETLSFQDTVKLEMIEGMFKSQVIHLVKEVDKDNDGYLSKEEFLNLVGKQSRKLENVQRSKFLKYLRVAAFADQYRWWPPPVFTILLMTFLVIIYIHQSILLSSADQLFEYPYCSPFALHPLYKQEIWRFISYSFAHHGLDHLCINILLLVLVGLPLEMTHGWARISLVYWIAVLTASFTYSLNRPCGVLVGCSAGIYSLTTAHLASLLLNWKEDTLVLRQRIRNKQASAPTFGRIIRICRLLLVVGILMVDVIDTLWTSNSQTSYTAHLTGSAVGILIGLVVLRNRRVDHWETWIKIASCSLVLVLLIIVVVLNVIQLQTDASLLCPKEEFAVCQCLSFTTRKCPSLLDN